MSEEQDKYWTRIAIEKENKVAYDDRSPEMNRGMTIEEPMKVPSNVFETLQELKSVVTEIDRLTDRKHGLIKLYQHRMEEASAGFESIVSRPSKDQPESEMAEAGFGKPRFGF